MLKLPDILSTNKSAKKQDLIYIAILLSVAVVIGVYLIATTVLIARDGLFYIERAQKFSSNPCGIIKAHPPGYPFLIFAAHKFACLFTDSSSVYTWIYSAQGVTLLCKLFALIPLYFVGKRLVGHRNSFWALVILVILPYPAKVSCEAVREWPYILFLAVGFLFLIAGAKHGKWWAFGLAGLCAGLGYLIRPMCAQLVVYGFIWLTLCMFRPKLSNMAGWKLPVALALLLISFAVPVVPYMRCTGQIIPPKAKSIIKSFSCNTPPDETYMPKDNQVSISYYVAEMGPRRVIKALGEIFRTIGENLMWVFIPALLAGLYCCFRQEANYEERFLIAAFILINITAMLLRYCCVQLHISRRWSLPLITFTIFYIPVGLHVVGDWLETKLPMNKQQANTSNKKSGAWFLLLVIVGIAVCIPKLIRPIRIEKQGYRDAAGWLSENTAPEDFVAVPDMRISFYAERKGVPYSNKIPKKAGYVVRIIKNEDEVLNPGRVVSEEYSVWLDKRRKNKKVIIYKGM